MTDPAHCGGCDVACSAQEACVLGKCTCAHTVCDTGSGPVCTSLDDDPGNCGACRHDCGGGACIDGTCQPIVLVDEQFPSSILIYKNALYWLTGTEVRRADITGKNPTTLATNAQFGGLTTPPFAVNPSGLFWGNGAQIFTIPLSGGTTPVPVVNEYNGGYMLDDVTADDSHLYWTTNDGFVKRGSPDGTNVTVLGSSQDSPDNIVVNATHVYWTNRRLQDSQTSGIMRCDLDGRNLTTVGLGAAGALALSGTHAYWSDGAFLWRSSLDGTNPESITKGSASAIFPDASNVYWVGNSASLFGFFKAPLTGGPSSLVVVASSTAFVTDDQFIYYTVSSNNPAVQSGVMRIAK
jgi:hypothetical protein